MSCNIGRILQFNEAVLYNTIVIINNNDDDIAKSSKFSWSVDGVCWTGWCDYNNYLMICKNISTDFYLRILIYDNIKQVFVGGQINECYSISLDNSNVFLKEFCGTPNLFQPYNNLDCALQLQQQLSDSIVCMFGIPIYYFKVSPIESSLDYTFKEYVLHNVVSVKQIKLMIQDGQMPSSNYRLTEFDFDWETDWETELSKTQFATAFGDTAFPSRNDFVYVPMMKRMWQVNSAYDEKNEGLMWRSTTWKLSLVKYNDSTNIDANGFDDIIDGLISSEYMNDVNPLEVEEQHRDTGADPISSPVFASNSVNDIRMNDFVRKSSTKLGVNIVDNIICHQRQVVGRNLYILDDDAFVTYQKGLCGDDGTINFVLYNNIKYDNPTNIIRFGNVTIGMDNYNIIYNNKTYDLEPHKVYLVVCRWNRMNYSTDIIIYEHKKPHNIPEYKITPEMYNFDFETPTISDVGIYNNDFRSNTQLECTLHGPCSLTNIKYYNRYLSDKELIKESLKYTTQDERCIINDLARPITAGYGYEVR